MFENSELLDFVLENTKDNDGDKTLYHYTSPDGLIGILQSGLFYASHSSVYNDPTEIRYGINKINNRIEQRHYDEKDKIAKKIIKGFLPTFKHNEELFINNELIFGLSLSEKGDLLSQWREYGKNGKGYSIGIKKSKIKCKDGLSVGEKTYNELFLVKMIYDEDTQNQIGDKLYETLIGDITNTKQIREQYFKLIVLLAMVMKHPAYSEEKEWRIIYRGNLTSYNENIISYRVNNDKIIPYVTLGYKEGIKDIHVLNNDITSCEIPLPVWHVFKGPAIRSMNYQMLSQFLHKCHYRKTITINELSGESNNVTIRESKCPYIKSI